MPVSSRFSARALPLFLIVSGLVHGLLFLVPAMQSAGRGQNGTGAVLAIQLTDWQGQGSPSSPLKAMQPKQGPAPHPTAKTKPRPPASHPQTARPKSSPRRAEVPVAAAISTPSVATPDPQVSEVSTANVNPVASAPPAADILSVVSNSMAVAENSSNASGGSGSAPASAAPATEARQGQGAAAGAGGTRALQTRFGISGGPQVVNMPRPTYPLRAKRLGKEGRVLLLLDIDPDGILRKAEVLEAAGFGFDEAALRAVRQARFRPAVEQGLAVACQAVLPVRFRLRPGGDEGTENNLF